MADSQAIDVQITNAQRTQKINRHWLQSVVVELFAELKIETADLGIKLVGAREMARVNWQFLQHEGSTDVITFDHAEPTMGNSRRKELHGELFICVDDAILQAQEFDTDWQSEVVRYTVHGVLHLLGYDDLKPALRREMKREENRLVRRLAGKFSFAQLSRTAKLRA
ncbi:MAG TPA: rRNA maturation RNase YbeY [Verrucomicrobiae bacterium]